MRILILQFRRLGDVLMTTPMLRALGQRLPDAAIDYCVEPSATPAISGNPYVRHTIAAPNGPSLRLVRGFRRARYDATIDSLGSPHSARVAWLTGAPIRIGPARRWRRMFYTHAVASSAGPRYSALGKLALLEPLGIHETDCRIEVFPSGPDRLEAERFWATLVVPPGRRVVAFSPVSRRATKRWPAERFAEVCDRWAERAGVSYLPLYGPGEHDQVEAVVDRARQRRAFLWPCPMVPFGVLAPVIERCSCYIGCDNGIRHVAVAAGIPTAAVFGPPDPRSWTPPDSTRHLWVGGRGPTDAIGVEDVDRMIGRLVDKWGSVNGDVR
jgi:ADP-heptose:LPS heptosyltransferase